MHLSCNFVDVYTKLGNVYQTFSGGIVGSTYSHKTSIIIHYFSGRVEQSVGCVYVCAPATLIFGMEIYLV